MTLLAAMCTLAIAAEPTDPPAPVKPPPSIKVSGLIFPRWSIDLTDGAKLANEFALDRTYLRVEATLNEQLGTRITLDSRRGEGGVAVMEDGSEITFEGDQRYGVFVKHAWVEWKPNAEIAVRGGIVDTLMIPFLQSWQGARWTHETFLDEADLESSADLGVNVAGKHVGGLVEWAAGVFNGETFKSPETGSGKSVKARFTLNPLATRKSGAVLPLTVFGDFNVQDEGAPPIFTWAADAGFKNPNLFADVEVIGSTQGSVSGLGVSGQLAAGVPKIGHFRVRVDHWDPDTQADGDDYLMILAGPTHDFREKGSIGLFYQRKIESAAPDAPESSVSLQGQVGF